MNFTNMTNKSYTREEVIKLVDEILQYPDQVIDAINNENTDYDAEKLIEIAENGLRNSSDESRFGRTTRA